jgi:malonate-semialdehyde dehydrogenase (acetylating)/methylmalonate-semialdehyde dehydrogenase
MSTQVASAEAVANFIGGKWQPSSATERTAVINPATQETIAHVPVGSAADVDAAVKAATAAFQSWRRTPPEDRIQPLFELKVLLEENLDELARTISRENGKTLGESKGELRRAIENVEVACGIPILMQGSILEDVARGIDEIMIRQPVGVVAAITPFNFPGMIPFWFLPYAIACGNAFILKPSERVPLTMRLAVELIAKTSLPPGVVNLINGGKTVVDALLDHPGIHAISFVGSTPVAKYVYARAAANGKRAQCQGGAKNHVIVLPDADMDSASRIVGDSAFGCAGQRCLAVSTVLTIGDAKSPFGEAMVEKASKLRTGSGLDTNIQMGPVITKESKSRIESLIGKGVQQAERVLLDGRNAKIDGFESGNFLKPTILDGVPIESELTDTEIFGPVLSLVHVRDLDEAIRFLEKSKFGNQASLFTSSGAAARQFRYEAPAGNIGINIGVAAPMAYFPFSGWKDSFFGDLHAQGHDSVDFYTQKKVVIERWSVEHSRKF